MVHIYPTDIYRMSHEIYTWFCCDLWLFAVTFAILVASSVMSIHILPAQFSDVTMKHIGETVQCQKTKHDAYSLQCTGMGGHSQSGYLPNKTHVLYKCDFSDCLLIFLYFNIGHRHALHGSFVAVINLTACILVYWCSFYCLCRFPRAVKMQLAYLYEIKWTGKFGMVHGIYGNSFHVILTHSTGLNDNIWFHTYCCICTHNSLTRNRLKIVYHM